MYFKEFDIRWSDIDANRHLANSAYVNFMSHTRMAYLIENGLSQKEMLTHNIGPVVFHEQIFFFKEAFQGKPITVSFELGGASKDGMFFKFVHNFYDHKGRNLARGSMQGGWMHLETRKLIGLPESLLPILDLAPKTSDFKILTKEDMRAHGQVPQHLDL
ncbi:MAG: acyl-CoA thioesterase [Dokdonia sp.]|jgi:acyl-CoA thioester hydrolase|tara:strand:- start:232 stop:711 length:480 start_codon:yes stop_codon:yes gene_type:complete